MNPHDELKALIGLFPDDRPLIERAEHIPSAMTPEPYKTMLVHNQHMTVTMESYHKSPVEVRVLDRRLEEDSYCRKIILLKQGTDDVVQFGIVRFDLKAVSAAVNAPVERTHASSVSACSQSARVFHMATRPEGWLVVVLAAFFHGETNQIIR